MRSVLGDKHDGIRERMVHKGERVERQFMRRRRMRVLNSTKKAKRGKEKESLEGFIRKECANFRSGECLGMDLHTRFCIPLPRCLLFMNLPCNHLEQYVLPLAPKLDAYAGMDSLYAQRFPTDQQWDFHLVDEMAEGLGDGELRDRYENHPFYEDHKRQKPGRSAVVRRCKCGAALTKRARCCPKCLQKQGRERRQQKKRRHLTKSSGK